MMPNRNLNLYKWMKNTGIGALCVNIKRISFVSMSLRDHWLYKVKIITMYGGVYNICKSKMYAKIRQNADRGEMEEHCWGFVFDSFEIQWQCWSFSFLFQRPQHNGQMSPYTPGTWIALITEMWTRWDWMVCCELRTRISLLFLLNKRLFQKPLPRASLFKFHSSGSYTLPPPAHRYSWPVSAVCP